MSYGQIFSGVRVFKLRHFVNARRFGHDCIPLTALVSWEMCDLQFSEDDDIVFSSSTVKYPAAPLFRPHPLVAIALNNLRHFHLAGQTVWPLSS
jgi:hypothetical protein